MKEYFQTRSIKDFKNSKLFWQFYSNSIKIKSDKSNNQLSIPGELYDDDKLLSLDQAAFGNVFNHFFSSLSSNSNGTSLSESDRYIDNTFNKLRTESLLPNSTFSFRPTSSVIVSNLLNKLDISSSPGIIGIPTKVLKLLYASLAPILTKIFNSCIVSGEIPLLWKQAVVSPLYKNKGNRSNVNNYRGISVLPPVAKVFEKILASQIIIYLNINKLLFNGQHGFRAGHSCETALQELLSDLFTNNDNKLITMLLFIDFRKAFDLVDSSKLLRKLFHYGFDNDSIKLVANYFQCRQQIVKYNNTLTDACDIKLGVPQGSVLGPLFFLIFINDLPYVLPDLCTKLFADDTTIYLADSDLNILINKFSIKLKPLFEWCYYNQMDINWSKTYFMFTTNKRIFKSIPSVISLDVNTNVNVVNKFKLLGVILDNKLNFLPYISFLKTQINKKLYCIRRIFYLSNAVKVQFFKTFICPYFDYCLSLSLYFPKYILQSILNCYNFCIFKLFKNKFSLNNLIIDNEDIKNQLSNLGVMDENEIFNFKMELLNLHNKELNKHGLFTLQHRIILKHLTFVNNIITGTNSPEILLKGISNTNQKSVMPSGSTSNILVLRNSKLVIRDRQPQTLKTFSFFYNKLLGVFRYLNFYDISSRFSKNISTSTHNLLYDFTSSFLNFNLNLKLYNDKFRLISL